MSYKVSVPVILQNLERQGREAILAQLRELNAERVYLSIGCYETDLEKRQNMLTELKENCDYFHQQGFEVGVWLWTFMFNEPTIFTQMSMVKEREEFNSVDACPLDEDFLKFSGEYLQDLARCGVDLIQFDDDFRFGFKPNNGMACICELHRKRICARLGEEISRAELAKKIMETPNNRYRDAWLAENGASLENFAQNCRFYVDEVNPSVRMGFCACMTAWDIDGTDAMKISRILAGNTAPFIRLIGAPYWASRFSWGNTLQDVVETERMESSWMDRSDIEIWAEGDAYPRPRIACPAAYLEGFDTAIRAAGCTDGILKYAIDYTASPRYENGYVEYHKRNRSLYEEIHSAFDGKDARGVRVYEAKCKVAGADVIGEDLPDKALQYMFFSNAARLLAAHAIPTTYEGKGTCGIAFGENAKYLTAEERKGGMILDGSAAIFLHERGVDVGIEEIGKKVSPAAEWFIEEQELITTYGMKFYGNRLKKDAKVLSEARASSGIVLLSGNVEDAIPMSYLYQNAEGERYLVLNFDGRIASKEYNDAYFRRQYLRGYQIEKVMPWLTGGKALPASCCGNPCLYMIAKEKDGQLAVGLWNFYPDPVWEPVVRLGEEYRELRVLNGGTGTMSGKTVSLGMIPPYGFAGFEVSM